MPLRSVTPAYQQVLAAEGTSLAVGEHVFGPFHMDTFQGILIDLTRSDDGTNGTLALVVKSWSDAGAAVEMNGLAAGENVRRQVQVHPTAGPAPADDADGVFKVGTTGIASNYYRQPMPPDFYVVATAATDASVVALSLAFLN
jgi:hypothetical protein